jgi:hypothetical protein
MTKINNKSSQTFNWFTYLLMFARFLRGGGGGGERGGFIKKLVQAKCMHSGSKWGGHYFIYLVIFLLLLLISQKDLLYVFGILHALLSNKNSCIQIKTNIFYQIFRISGGAMPVFPYY